MRYSRLVISILLASRVISPAVVGAQVPSTPEVAPSPSAAPPASNAPAGVQQVTAKTSLALSPKDPWGVALHGGLPTVRLGGLNALSKNYVGGRTEAGSIRLEWGATLDDTQTALGDLPHFHIGNFDQGGGKALSCSPDNDGSRTCFSAPGAPWYVDFGQSSVGAVNPFITFAPDGRFFRYIADFRTDSFDEIYQTLVKRFGTPTAHTNSSVQNRMGAKFAQEEATWVTPHTQVTIERRGASVDRGLLSVVYLPIAQQLPPKPEAKSPM